MVVRLPGLERKLSEALAAIRSHQATRPPERRLHWNRVLLYVWPPLELHGRRAARHRAPAGPRDRGPRHGRGGRARAPDASSRPGELREALVQLSNPTGAGFMVRFASAVGRAAAAAHGVRAAVVSTAAARPRLPVRARSRCSRPPRTASAASSRRASSSSTTSTSGRLVPVDRPHGQQHGQHRGGGRPQRHRAPIPRAWPEWSLLGDPSTGLGSLAEPECRRIIAALDLAEELGVPLEWFALSAGAKIAMDSGTENMDWIARVLRRHHRVHPGRRRDQRGGAPASTSAPSRTGTPKRRC